MTCSITEKIKGFLLNPVEAFQASKADEPKEVFTYLGVLFLIYSVLYTIIDVLGLNGTQSTALFGASAGAAGLVFLFIFTLVGGIIFTLVFALWIHLWVYILGGRKGIMQTIKAFVYASTPELLLGWIPFIGFIFSIWSLVLGILGIRELQELSTAKSVIVFVIAVLIPLILIILLAAFLLVSYMTVTGGPMTMDNPGF